MIEEMVSIIVPVYNVEKYLRECVDSIVGQTYTKLEIILVDDGATDNSGTICDEYEELDSRVTVIHKENGGLSDARNAGLEEINGEYVLFCDSDDTLKNNAIELLYQRLSADKEADFVFYNAEAFAEKGLECNSSSYLRKKDYPVTSGAEAGFMQMVRDEFIPSACLFLFRSDFLQRYDLKFEKGILGEDELFSYYVYMNAQRVIYLPDALYNRRVRPGSIMTSKDNLEKKFQSYFEIVRKMYYAKERGRDIKTSNEFLDRMAKSAVYVYKKLDSEQKDRQAESFEILEKMIRENSGFGDPSLLIRLKCWKLGVMISGIRKYTRMILLG